MALALVKFLLWSDCAVRDILLLLLILSACPLIMRRPTFGLITWAWFTLMTPHQAAFGVYGVPLNLLIAAATITGFIFNGAFLKARIDFISAMMIAFAAWLSIAQLFSLDPVNSAPYTDRFLKVLVFAFLAAQFLKSRKDINAMVWTIVLSLGFFAAKGAIFTLLTLGQYRVQGLANTTLEDNNHFGIAIAAGLPLIVYLFQQTAHRYVRWALLGLIAATIFAIIGTQSRGGFIALLVFGGTFWWMSKRKLLIAMGLSIALVPSIAFMPASWGDRMATIHTATQDESFMGRVDAWIINAKLADAHPVTGAGLRNSYQIDVAKSVDPERAESAKAAHSIYFEILGGAGYVGLWFFLVLYGGAVLKARWLANKRPSADIPGWKRALGANASISLLIFAVGGASVSMEMWDGYWLVIALIVATANSVQTQTLSTGAALIKERRRTINPKALIAAKAL